MRQVPQYLRQSSRQIIRSLTKQNPDKFIQTLLNILARHPEGLATPDIEKQLDAGLPRRTLQYRLQQLANQGRLQRIGRGRGMKYRLAPVDPAANPPAEPEDDDAQHIRLSGPAQAIRAHLRQPLAARKPVGFNRRFLDSYEPNVTYYLTANDRENLRRTGQRPASSQPAGTYARQILNRLLIDLAWNSSRLEGNTYSLLDTRRLIEFGEEASGRGYVEAQMILNHKDAIEFLVDSADDIGFNRYSILNLHALLSNNLLPDPGAPGRLRFIPVGIEQSVFYPLEVPQLIEEYFTQILQKAGAITDPFEQAFFVMVHLPYLQPFDDVNKRVSRLAANIPLIRENLAPLSFVDVPRRIYTDAMLGIYELNDPALLRDVFCWAYERSAARYAAVRQSLGKPDPLRLRYRDELREIVAWIVRQNIQRRQVVPRMRAWTEERIEPADRERFIEVVEEELISLHEGNFARFQLKPSEFAAWEKAWKGA